LRHIQFYRRGRRTKRRRSKARIDKGRETEIVLEEGRSGEEGAC